MTCPLKLDQNYLQHAAKTLTLTSHWMKECACLCSSKSAMETQKTSDTSQTHALYNTGEIKCLK